MQHSVALSFFLDYFSPGKVLKRGIWEDAFQVCDPELKSLAKSLPNVLMAALAPTTSDKYGRGWGRWVDWAQSKPEVTVLPADAFYVAIFLNHLVVANGTVGAIRDAVYGINWAHHAAGYNSPTEDPFVELVHKRAERLCGKPRTKTDPLTAPFIKPLFDYYRPISGGHQNLKTLRFLLLALLGFAGFFRLAELLSTKLTNVHAHVDHLTIFLPKCKIDQVRQGNTVYISRLGSRYCPVGLLEDFLSAANITLHAAKDEHLIPRLIKIREGTKYPLR